MVKFAKPTGEQIKKALMGSSAAVALAATVMIFPSEGIVLSTYRDPVGILTYCGGETHGAVPGKTYSMGECLDIGAERIAAFEKSITKCLPTYASFPVPTKAAILSFTYNVGEGVTCGANTAVGKAFRRGDIRAGCEAFMLYTKAGRPLRELPGLVKRRALEKSFCLKGVATGTLGGAH